MPGINYISLTNQYISGYYRLPKKPFWRNTLTIQVNQSVYNQYYNIFLKNSSGRQKNHFADQLTRTFFYIHFNWVLNQCSPVEISRDELQYVITNNPNQVTKYRDILESLHTISVSKSFKKYLSNGITKYNKEDYAYQALENLDSLVLSKKYIDIVYQIPDDKVHQIKEQIRINKSSIGPIIPSHNIYVSSSQPNDCPTMNYIRRCTALEDLLKTYQKLEYRDILGNIFASETEKLQRKPAVFKSDRDKRIYHYFHSLSSDVRSSSITLNGDYITEAFDIHNACFCFLYCLLDDTVSPSDRNRYYDLVMSGKFYEDVQLWVNKTYNTSWDRDYAKTNANAYLNLSNEKVERALKAKKSANVAKICVYRYFEENFPSIQQFICNNKDCLHNMINEAETKVMVNIWMTLYEQYNIEGVTLHDALYIRKCDYKQLKDNNISVEKMFKDNIDMYNFLTKI